MFCPFCGKSVQVECMYCPHCGSSRNPAQHAHAHPKRVAALPAINNPPPVLIANLRYDEKMLGVWRAGHVHPENAPAGEGGAAVASSGILIATDQRLIFMQEKGVLNKSYSLEHSIELDHITAYRLASYMQAKGLEVVVDDKVRPRLERFSNVLEVDPSSLKMVRTVPIEESRTFFDQLMGRR